MELSVLLSYYSSSWPDSHLGQLTPSKTIPRAAQQLALVRDHSWQHLYVEPHSFRDLGTKASAAWMWDVPYQLFFLPNNTTQSTKLNVTAMPRKASHCAVTPLLPRQVGHSFLNILIPGPWGGCGFIFTSSVLALLFSVRRKPPRSLANPTFSPTVADVVVTPADVVVHLVLSKRFSGSSFQNFMSSNLYLLVS